MEKPVVIISFSSRNDGNCEKISEYIRSLQNLSVKEYRFTDFSIHPCGACRYECFENNRNCPYIDDMEYTILDEICASAFTFFVLPNYCNFPPAQFIVVSNTGKENFVEALRQHTNDEPEILFLSAKCYGKVSIAGDILESEAAKADIRSFIHL